MSSRNDLFHRIRNSEHIRSVRNSHNSCPTSQKAIEVFQIQPHVLQYHDNNSHVIVNLPQ